MQALDDMKDLFSPNAPRDVETDTLEVAIEHKNRLVIVKGHVVLDDDPLIRPDKHIYVEFKAPWDHIADDLPQMTKSALRASRGRST